MARKRQPEADPHDAFEALADVVRRLEAVHDEKDKAVDDIRVIYAEAKSEGFNPTVIRKVIAKRRQDQAAARKLEESIEMYEDALKQAGSNQG